MVFPISDDNSDRVIVPIVNYVLIAVNVLVFVVFQGMGGNEDFTYKFSCYPEKIAEGQDLERPAEFGADRAGRMVEVRPAVPLTPVPVYLTLLTAAFLHANFMHILGNMWFLWIFGDNIENYLGHARYLAFYLVCAILSGLAHVMVTVAYGGDALIPSLGASGAISGVMGAYLLLFPFRRVTVILFRFLTQVPAYVAVGAWFVLQLVSVMGLLGGGPQAGGGVAYGAHVGGFIAGVVLIKPFGFGLPPAGWPQPPAEPGDYPRY